MAGTGDAVSDPAPRKGRAERWDSWIWGAFALALVAGIAAILCVPYIPTHDGPQHIYVAYVLNHYSDPGAPYADFYLPTWPLSAAGFTLFFAPLEAWLGWRGATRAVVILIVVLWGLGFASLLRAVRKERVVLGSLGFVLGFQWALYMGFFSFLLSTGLGLVTIATALRSDSWSWRRRLGIATLLALQSMLHVFGAQATALVLVCLVAARLTRRNWMRELGMLALIGLPALAMTAYAAGRLGASTVALETNHSATYASFGERLLLLRSAFVGGPGWRAWPVLLGMITALGIGLARWRDKLSRDERALLVAGAALVLLFFVMPIHLLGWQFVSPQFLPLAAAVLLPLLPWETLPSARRTTASAAIACFVLCALGWTAWFHRDLDARTRDVSEALRASYKSKGIRLPIVLDSSAGLTYDGHRAPYAFYEPLLNIGALFAVEQGGVVPYTFTTTPQFHVFTLSETGWRKFPPVPRRFELSRAWSDAVGQGAYDEARAIDTLFAEYGAKFNDVILHTPAGNLGLYLARGYTTALHEGNVSVLRFQGCPVRFATKSDVELTSDLVVEYGWEPIRDMIEVVRAPAGKAPEGGWVATGMAPTPCGAVWARIFLDEDRSGSLSPGDAVCAAADSEGLVFVNLQEDSRTIQCAELRRHRPKPGQ